MAAIAPVNVLLGPESELMAASRENHIPDDKGIRRTSNFHKACLRMALGGIVGASIPLCIVRGFACFFNKTIPTPNPLVGSGLVFAWFGFVLGGLLSLFSRRWDN